jgi:ATP-dependent Clp protease ATP-binding subunit ClpC
MVSRNLPEFPNLDHLRKQAKALLRELQHQNPKARLAEAQLSIARKYGYPSWTKLKTHIESLPRPASVAIGEEVAGSGGSGAGTTLAGSVSGGDSGPGLFVRFTEKARRMVFFARYWAGKLGSATIEPDHVVRGLLQEEADFIRRVLGNALPSEGILAGVDQGGGVMEVISGTHPTLLSAQTRRILHLAAEEADRLGHTDISIGHFWLALLAGGNSRAMLILIDILKENGLSISNTRKRIEELIHEELSSDE